MQDKQECWTLGKGRKAKKFWVVNDEKSITLYSGAEGKSITKLTFQQINGCLQYFADRGWFILGNGIDNIKPGGLGEYFTKHLKKSAKAASHFAALMVAQRKLEYREGPHGRIELRVTK